jgi:hypothetical protein
MLGKQGEFLANPGHSRSSIDLWQSVARNSRQFLKGWGANLGKDKRDLKEDLLRQVAELDAVADVAG